MLPYSNSNNPFKDDRLDKVFVWKKKAKRLGWSKAEAKARAEELRSKNIPEITNAKRRRIEREEELAARQAERERQDRERDSVSYLGWESREEQFMLKQNQQASAIRINRGRETPIDLITRNVLLAKQLRFGPEIGPDGKPTSLLDSGVGLQTVSPLEALERLTLEELSQVKDDLVKFRRLESDAFSAYWDALLVVCNSEISEKREGGDASHVPKVIRDSMWSDYANKTCDVIRQEIVDTERRMASAASTDDRSFFQDLVTCLRVQEARALIRDVHNDMARTIKESGRETHHIAHSTRQSDFVPARVMEEEEDEDEDQVETSFNDLVDLPDEVNKDGRTGWVKPRYWNRMKKGFDWNKYNRAHYDHDNPPPKSVIGYKFNIMYPGLKTTPKYRVDADPSDPVHYNILRFSASYPFADVAFRIDNRQWERGTHSGFKNSFENGVLQLHFNFPRKRYRR